MIYTVKPGTKTGTKVRLKGKGVPTIRNRQIRGDHYLTLEVDVPTHLTSEQKDLLRQFEESMTGRPAGTAEDGTKDSEAKGKKSKKKGLFK